jgi:GT2 family glycosyltransferase
MREMEMKILIAIPCMDMIDTAFVQSLMGLDLAEEVRIKFLPGSLVYDSRNQLTEIARASECEYIFFLDSDMTFKGDILKRLLEDAEKEELDIVTGLAFTRRMPIRTAIFKKCEYSVDKDGQLFPDAENYNDYPRDSLFPVQACGMACCLIRMSMVDKVFKNYGLPFSPAQGWGEDLSFCIRARELGAKIYCDSRVKVGHIGKMVVDEEMFLRSENNA